MSLIKGLLLVGGVVIALGAGHSSASQSLAYNLDTKRQLGQLVQESNKVQSKVSKPCQLVRLRLEAQSQKSQLIGRDRSDTYDQVASRVSDLSNRLAASGVDNAELKSKIDELYTQISDYKKNLVDYTSALDLAATKACDTKAELMQQIEITKNARVKLEAVANSTDELLRGSILRTISNIDPDQGDLPDTNNSKNGANNDN